MLENYSDSITILGTISLGFLSYYYIINYIYNYNNINIQKFTDFDYNIYNNQIKLINNTGLKLKIIGGTDYNKNLLNKVIENGNDCANLNFKKIFFNLYKDKDKDKDEDIDFIGNSYISLIEGCDGMYLYDSNEILMFNFKYNESDINHNNYVFEIIAPNLYNLHKFFIEKDNNEKIQELS